jgi:hypothetical protein
VRYLRAIKRVTIRVEPRGPEEEREVDESFLEQPPDLDLGNGLWAYFSHVDDEGVYVYEEKIVLPPASEVRPPPT